MVCIAALLFLILGTIKPLHPLDKKLGQTVSFTIWIIIIIGFALLYTIDFVRYILERHHFQVTDAFLALENAKMAQIHTSNLSLWFNMDNEVNYFIINLFKNCLLFVFFS